VATPARSHQNARVSFRISPIALRNVLEDPSGSLPLGRKGGTLDGAGERVSDVPKGGVIDVSDVRRGTPEYEALNNPRPNTTTELSNGTTFRTGEGGYVDEVTYQPVNSPGVRDGRQTAVGREGIAGDVGGHIQACRHGGTCDRFDLFPQNSNFNNRTYKRWENEITRSLQNGDDVGNVTIRLNRADPYNPRPDSLTIEYEINGVPFERRFNNQAGH
jgi:filamentous hemagglutinin